MRTGFDLPGLVDFVGTPGEARHAEPETEKSEVAQWFETGR